MQARIVVGGVAILLAALTCAPAAAEDTGISVIGTGEVKAKPNLVEFEFQTAGAAELTGDAVVKYRETKRRTLEAFDKLKLKNMEIAEQGIGLSTSGASNPQMMMALAAGGQAPAVKPQVQIARSIRMTLKGIQAMEEEDLMETIGKILDTAKDAGTVIGPSQSDANALLARMYGQQMSSSMCTFVLDNPAELRKQAYQKAFDQARSQAERLASLADVRLGKVLSVQESATPSSGSNNNIQMQFMMAMYGMRDSSAPDDLRVTSDKFGEIPVRVTLQIRFAIEKKE